MNCTHEFVDQVNFLYFNLRTGLEMCLPFDATCSTMYSV